MKRSYLSARLAAIILPIALFVGCNSGNQPPILEAGTTQTSTEKTMAAAGHTDSGSGTAEATSLADQLNARVKVSAAKFPAKVMESFAEGIQMVRDSGIEKSAKQVGDSAVDGELIGWDGKTIKLSNLWSEGPVVLMWYRGGWCPYCNIQLRAMQQSLDEIENAGARLVVLTPEIPEKAKETAEANDIKIVALHDKNNQLADKFGIMFDLPAPIVPVYRDKLKLPSYNGNDNLQLPLAATYVIDKTGAITYAFLDADYKKRAEPAEVVAAVKSAAGM